MTTETRYGFNATEYTLVNDRHIVRPLFTTDMRRNWDDDKLAHAAEGQHGLGYLYVRVTGRKVVWNSDVGGFCVKVKVDYVDFGERTTFDAYVRRTDFGGCISVGKVKDTFS